MTRPMCIISIAAVLGLFAACGDDESEPMTGLLEAFEAEVASLQETAAAHDTAVQGAADLAAIIAEESSYAADAHSHHDALHHGMEEMTGCSHDGTAPDVGEMGTSLTALDAELDAHADAMAAAADTGAALTEESRHQSALASIISELEAVHDALHATAGEFSCPHHHDDGHGGGH